MSSYATEVNAARFDDEVIERSRQVPVLVDFWAPWCGPCRALTPVLDKLAEEYQGRFHLVKVNSDENAQLAQKYGVRSIPNVKAFVDGELVDEFMGAVPESSVRRFIEGLLPGAGERRRREAQAACAAGDPERALSLLAQAAQEEPNNDRIHADRIDALLALGRTEEAQAAARDLGPLATDDPRIAALLARLHFAAPAGAGDEKRLQARIDADPGDLEARLGLAKLQVNRGSYEPALDQLMEIVRRDRAWSDEAGRKTMLAAFDLLGARNELVSKYRRLLAAALH
jgi:putative thioredoxin